MKINNLTDRHREMLVVLASGLHFGYTKPTWAIFFTDANAYLIVGLDDRNRMSATSKKLWYTITYEDIDLFIEAGFMQDLHKMAISPNRYLYLNVEHIIENFLSNTACKK